MKQAEFEHFILKLPYVQREMSFGYSFFFVGDDHRLPFVTIADSDNDYDEVSNLNREDVFRLNIGVSKDTYLSLIDEKFDGDIDFSVLNRFLPHPQYSCQHFVCILNPEGENAERAKQLIVEARAIAEGRGARK